MSPTESQTDARRGKQIGEAGELLFAGPQKSGVAKGLFPGRCGADGGTGKIQKYKVREISVAELGAGLAPARAERFSERLQVR